MYSIQISTYKHIHFISRITLDIARTHRKHIHDHQILKDWIRDKTIAFTISPFDATILRGIFQDLESHNPRYAIHAEREVRRSILTIVYSSGTNLQRPPCPLVDIC
jgi:hypothetical protein